MFSLSDAASLQPDTFQDRHLGPNPTTLPQLLSQCGVDTLDGLIQQAVPASIRLKNPLKLPPARSETQVLKDLLSLSQQNQVARSYLGMGYYGTHVPPVIQRNLLENPAWYTQYTPYQAEIAQGRLEGLLNFQTMVCDLTGMDIANASLLDEATAAAEAMTMAYGLKGSSEKRVFRVDLRCHPQTIELLKTRAEPLGLEVEVVDVLSTEWKSVLFGTIIQYPASEGEILDYRSLVESAHAQDALVVVASDLLALTLLRPPGEWGADIVVGSAQRFGVPMGFGGPHAAFFSTKNAYKRQMPGRLVGVSKDSRGLPAYRLSLQTREQHIRREKATSNICTAQALLANMAVMYAIYHGPKRLIRIAEKVQGLTHLLRLGLMKMGYSVTQGPIFDTLKITFPVPNACQKISVKAQRELINLRRINPLELGISLDETTEPTDVEQLLHIFNHDPSTPAPDLKTLESALDSLSTDAFRRTGPILQFPVFNQYHSETEMLRYLRRLESRDLSLVTSMIPLGSCTMKLNASFEMMPVSWPGFNSLHPFAPDEQTRGYQRLFADLEGWLAEITGFHSVSLQPNAGSQGEYAGLLAIRKYHHHHQQAHRTVCLIPQSAHGTNPASAVMAGLRVVSVQCDANGNIDLSDLEAKARIHASELAAIMVTYPSTHGVFEESIRSLCDIVHRHGGLVYLDGANLNAQVGLCRPGDFGADVCHLNLHKTFCIPHGGGGPGMGPIAVSERLAPFLPGHPLKASETPLGPISAAPYGSASILTISWAYIAAMGAEGLTQATKMAILNANYIAKRLENYYPVLYRGPGGWVAHECILDLRPFKIVTVEDVAKRLMDFSFHAPTISWPVAGTMMVEPTESESKEELDRFCEAMIQIHGEIMAIETGQVDAKDNLLKNSPHTADQISCETWSHPYSRNQAAFPAPWLRENKFWPSVGRIDNVHGDRNLVCTCVGMEAYSPTN